MKKTALAALIALTGAAFAGETAKTGTTPAACVETTLDAKVDCATTGSLDKTYQTGSAKTDAKDPRLGIDVNPWILPTTF